MTVDAHSPAVRTPFIHCAVVGDAWNNAAVNTDSFWALIEECRRQTQSRDGRLALLRSELSRRPIAEIARFQVCLDRVTDQACTWDLMAAAERIRGHWSCQDVEFGYFGLWMVGLGRDAFTRAVVRPDTLADTAEVRWLADRPRDEWNDNRPEWGALDHVAVQAYGLRTGEADGYEDAFDEAVEAQRGDEVFRGLAGDQWDVSEEDEAARRLPQLSAMFACTPFPR
ncbi:DUF4240 domain-containing protein [Streptomyces sp. NPDC058572]|uniref:DUF4240 domain-containing protein n=1 Tax=Streptomyces sp. NPDC058572 TaxID=3346546 RepID=UPI0036554DB0